jgi:hypothetical protein
MSGTLKTVAGVLIEFEHFFCENGNADITYRL